ncbi:DUF4240 domain-containing protein [Neolewinella lacunae]|uniref:DUF4240 domain-containing protein n=1 Tax=Neolewinella lacunae TaxID=1517758 RepID=A0A923T8F9_9BACT|nr:DUF4240 domain-containing protein [Neolewinella lacunae]MBC6993913.1 DUF4240 domain-containing protein [Neolewinella lacunae]MDN3635005.1 DUF4240 domain-containing protein [Neolewinella lacunae]
MATVLKVNINDLNSQFFLDLGQKVADATEIEIRIPDQPSKIELFPDADFWKIIDCLDWSKEEPAEILLPAIKKLAAMPVVNIYLFADKLAEKLFELDTRSHGEAYLQQVGEDDISIDDFLYARCAVVAEGKSYFEEVLQDPQAISGESTFESILNLPDGAYELKTGREFEYLPSINHETYSNHINWN